MSIGFQPSASERVIRLLLLAGTGEARALAARLVGRPGTETVVSLAGATRAPLPQGLPTRSGGFGGEAGQAAWLADHAITHVIDATHPFAARISQRTAALCARLGIAYLQLLRPGWTAGPGDHWTLIDAETGAAAVIPPGATVFLATGRQRLEDFAGLAGNRLYCRRIDPPEAPFPFPNGEYIVGRPPFSVADEVALFTRLKIDWLVVKDAGGAASRTKLDAARDLGLPVLMIRRPPQPEAERVETVAAALDWLAR
jgi:precorrin-6A/cobalt-precorrin-6A reductase